MTRRRALRKGDGVASTKHAACGLVLQRTSGCKCDEDISNGSTCGLTAEQLGYAVILGIDLCDNVLSAP